MCGFCGREGNWASRVRCLCGTLAPSATYHKAIRADADAHAGQCGRQQQQVVSKQPRPGVGNGRRIRNRWNSPDSGGGLAKKLKAAEQDNARLRQQLHGEGHADDDGDAEFADPTNEGSHDDAVADFNRQLREFEALAKHEISEVAAIGAAKAEALRKEWAGKKTPAAMLINAQRKLAKAKQKHSAAEVKAKDIKARLDELRVQHDEALATMVSSANDVASCEQLQREAAARAAEEVAPSVAAAFPTAANAPAMEAPVLSIEDAGEDTELRAILEHPGIAKLNALIGSKVKAAAVPAGASASSTKRSAEEADLGDDDGEVDITVDDAKLIAALGECGEAAQQGPEQLAKYLKEHLGSAVRAGAIKAKHRYQPYP